VVVEVAGDDLLQLSSLLGNRLMHAPSQFLFDGLQLYPHAIPPRLPFDLEFAPASFAADKGVSRPAGFHHRPLAEPSVIEDVISRHELDSIANSFAVAAGLDIETVNNRLSFVRPSQETAYEAPSV
jgi:hypothetical protein